MNNNKLHKITIKIYSFYSNKIRIYNSNYGFYVFREDYRGIGAPMLEFYSSRVDLPKNSGDAGDSSVPIPAQRI